jgi:hypothetical protein
MPIWIVGRNKHTKEWSEGGTLAEYPLEHWEVFQVEASDRDKARKAAQQVRRLRVAKERRQKKAKA